PENSWRVEIEGPSIRRSTEDRSSRRTPFSSKDVSWHIFGQKYRHRDGVLRQSQLSGNSRRRSAARFALLHRTLRFLRSGRRGGGRKEFRGRSRTGLVSGRSPRVVGSSWSGAGIDLEVL